MNEYRIDISFSNQDMDCWDEGRKVRFYLSSTNMITLEGKSYIAQAYLDSLGVSYREMWSRMYVKDANGDYIRVER